jgi:DNA polymerase III subunit gamma/tau
MAAIYQQARPFTFDQVVGQNHVKDVLVAALERNRIGHAYLFSGPRGVGKTTTARLLAMAVNCENPDPAKRPCGVCESCKLVRAGNHPDVTELDAASNNSVDDVRDLREKVRLASMRGGKRVWVLDEAHMLSRAASNALLKTLEEPPENLVFILATTEPEKLPATILSRCQHFRFRRLSEAEIRSKLERLCQEANVKAETEALSLVARAADGAMRDAESLLERLLTSGQTITRVMAEDALGLPPAEQMQKLASYVSEQNLEGMFALASELYQAGFAPSSLAETLVKTLRDALVNKVNKDSSFTLELAENDLLRMIQTLDDELEKFSRRDNLFALEVALIKAVNSLHPVQQIVSEVSQSAAKATSTLPDFDPTSRVGKGDKETRRQGDSSPSSPLVPSSSPSTSEPKASNAQAPNFNWYEVKSRSSAQLKAFLMPALDEVDGFNITLRYEEKSRFHFSQIKQRQEELLALVTELFGDGYKITLVGPGESRKKS